MRLASPLSTLWDAQYATTAGWLCGSLIAAIALGACPDCRAPACPCRCCWVVPHTSPCTDGCWVQGCGSADDQGWPHATAAAGSGGVLVWCTEGYVAPQHGTLGGGKRGSECALHVAPECSPLRSFRPYMRRRTRTCTLSSQRTLWRTPPTTPHLQAPACTACHLHACLHVPTNQAPSRQ